MVESCLGSDIYRKKGEKMRSYKVDKEDRVYTEDHKYIGKYNEMLEEVRRKVDESLDNRMIRTLAKIK